MSFPTGHNPYSAPETDIELIDAPLGGDLAEAELIRRQYVRHEAAVKSIGLLDYLGCVMLVLGGLFFLLADPASLGLARLPDDEKQTAQVLMRVVAGFVLAFGILAGFAGAAIRKLRPWARWLHVIMGSLSVLQFLIIVATSASRPDGPQRIGSQVLSLMMNVYILSLLLSAKGAVVFSASYRRVIEQTPHIRAGTSVIVKILLGILVFIIAMAVIFGILAALSGPR